MYQLLVYVKMLLNQLEIDTGLSGAVNNKEAAKLYDNDFEQFKLKVKETIDQCSQRVYDSPPINADDAHAIRFSQLSEDNLDKVKLNMINSIIKSNQNSLLSSINSNAGDSGACGGGGGDGRGSSAGSSTKSHNLHNSTSSINDMAYNGGGHSKS
jgi:hypothetical protein